MFRLVWATERVKKISERETVKADHKNDLCVAYVAAVGCASGQWRVSPTEEGTMGSHLGALRQDHTRGRTGPGCHQSCHQSCHQNHPPQPSSAKSLPTGPLHFSLNRQSLGEESVTWEASCPQTLSSVRKTSHVFVDTTARFLSDSHQSEKPGVYSMAYAFEKWKNKTK